jgi:hypothetical protein
MATRLVADLKTAFHEPQKSAGVNPGTRELTAEELIDRELQELDLLGDQQ